MGLIYAEVSPKSSSAALGDGVPFLPFAKGTGGGAGGGLGTSDGTGAAAGAISAAVDGVS